MPPPSVRAQWHLVPLVLVLGMGSHAVAHALAPTEPLLAGACSLLSSAPLSAAAERDAVSCRAWAWQNWACRPCCTPA